MLALFLMACSHTDPAPVTGSVNYTVSSTSGNLTISYQDGVIKTFPITAANWDYSFVGKEHDPAYISVTSSANSSTVIVKIFFRGKEIATKTGLGTATANASL